MDGAEGAPPVSSVDPAGTARIRPARMDEVDALRDVIEDSVFGLGSAAYSRAQLESAMRHVFGVDTCLIADGTYYAVEGDGGRLLACGGWSRRRTLFGGDQYASRSDDRLDPAREGARIRAFFVRPSAARRGIGRSLLEECERAARVEGFRRLELMATLTGVALYERFGFRAAEPVELEFPDGIRFPLLRMERDL